MAKIHNVTTRLLGPLVILFLILAYPVMTFAHDPITTQITWNRDISRIVYNRCSSCHHDGGAAFSLMNYQVARPWAKAIKEEVLERRMPPFAAVKGFGEVKDEDALTQEELHLIADWVEGGSPEGDDPKLLPKLPEFHDGKGATAAAGTSTDTLDKSASQLVSGNLTLKAQLTLIGVRAVGMAEGTSVQEWPRNQMAVLSR